MVQDIIVYSILIGVIAKSILGLIRFTKKTEKPHVGCEGCFNCTTIKKNTGKS